MDELAKQGLLGNRQSSLPAAAGLDPSECFHMAPYTETLLQTLGRSKKCTALPFIKSDNLIRGFS